MQLSVRSYHFIAITVESFVVSGSCLYFQAKIVNDVGARRADAQVSDIVTCSVASE